MFSGRCPATPGGQEFRQHTSLNCVPERLQASGYFRSPVPNEPVELADHAIGRLALEACMSTTQMDSVGDDARPLDPCGHDGPAYHPGNVAFRRHHMGRILRRIGMLLPQLLAGHELIRAALHLEYFCWRELGHAKPPIFDGDIPPFLLVNEHGVPREELSQPMEPLQLAAKFAALKPRSPPGPSPVGTNLQTLARLLNFTTVENERLLWAYCRQRFGQGILPTVPLCDKDHSVAVLALLWEMPVDAVRAAVSPNRLRNLGLLSGPQTDGVARRGAVIASLGDWLSTTWHFLEWIEQPYPSDAALLTALRQAQLSFQASL